MRCLLRRRMTARARACPVSNVRSPKVAAARGGPATGPRGGASRPAHLRIRRRGNRRCDRQRGGAWWPVILRDIPDGVPVVCQVLRGLEEALPRRRQRRVVFLNRRHACCCSAPPRCCKLLFKARAKRRELTKERRARRLKFIEVGAYTAATPSRSFRCFDVSMPGVRAWYSKAPKGSDMNAKSSDYRQAATLEECHACASCRLTYAESICTECRRSPNLDLRSACGTDNGSPFCWPSCSARLHVAAARLATPLRC